MAKDAKISKSETLTIRLDPKTRFVLDYMSRLKGQTITTVVERAIVAAASNTPIPRGEYEPDIVWQDIWDVSEGVRALTMATIPEMYPTYEEERRLAFAREHWPFFYASEKKEKLLNYYVDVLWPRIDQFVQLHDDRKHEDYFAAGEAMQDALRAARLEAPEWPIPKKSPKVMDDDQDIPF